jgi:O-antigen/teichoic acid export membrane protein
VVAENFLWLSAGRLAGLVVSFFSGIYARRVLGVVAIGQYSWCLSVVSYFSLLVDPGLEKIANRDVARDPSQTELRLSQLLALRFTFAAVAFGVVGVLTATGLRGPTISHLLLLSAIALLLVPFDLTWLLQAHERMAPAAIAQLVVQILRLPLLVLLVHEPANVDRYILLWYPLQIGFSGYICWFAGHHGLLRWSRVRPTFRGAWPLVKEALPVGLSQASTHLYYNFDAILLGFLRDDATVGIYSTAYGVMLIPTFLSAALTQAYFPHLSRVYQDKRLSVSASSDFLTIHMWIGMPLAALGWAFGRHVMVLLYGSGFAESGPLLEWLALNLALIFFSTGIGMPLTTWGLQRIYLKIALTGAIVNVVLNFILIPYFGVWGAVITTLLAEGIVGFGCLWARRRHVALRWQRIVTKPLGVCIVAAVIGRYLALTFPDQWVISLLLVAVGILVAFWLTERNDLAALWSRFRNAAEPSGS